MKTKSLIFTISISVLLILSVSAATKKQINITASNKYITKEIGSVQDFNKIVSTGFATVEYKQSSGRPKVSIYGSDNVIEYFDVYTEKGTLVIKMRDNVNVNVKGDHKITITASSPDLYSGVISGSGKLNVANGIDTRQDAVFTVTGSGRIEVKSLKCSDLKTVVSGSGKVYVKNISCKDIHASVTGSGKVDVENARCGNANANVSGSGKLSLSGLAEKANYSVTGSGKIEGGQLKAPNTQVVISGSGKTSCYAEDVLNARITGSGKVEYYGNPQKTNLSGRESSFTRL